MSASVAEAVAALRRGEVIGLPTETVYGLAADAADAAAVAKIFALKGRPADHPLIVHIAGEARTTRRLDANIRARFAIKPEVDEVFTFVGEMAVVRRS